MASQLLGPAGGLTDEGAHTGVRDGSGAPQLLVHVRASTASDDTRRAAFDEEDHHGAGDIEIEPSKTIDLWELRTSVWNAAATPS
jgi:hypothetical protein